MSARERELGALPSPICPRLIPLCGIGRGLMVFKGGGKPRTFNIERRTSKGGRCAAHLKNPDFTSSIIRGARSWGLPCNWQCLDAVDRGNIIGIVSAKLDASAALAASGALPENVNYAMKSSLLLSFLESVPAVSARLKAPITADRKFEGVVKSAPDAAVLVLVC